MVLALIRGQLSKPDDVGFINDILKMCRKYKLSLTLADTNTPYDLHPHPKMQAELGLDENHLIVDKEAWKLVMIPKMEGGGE